MLTTKSQEPTLFISRSQAGLAIAILVVGRPLHEALGDYCVAEVHLVFGAQSSRTYLNKAFVLDHLDAAEPEEMMRQYALYWVHDQLAAHFEAWSRTNGAQSFAWPALERECDLQATRLWLREFLGEEYCDAMRRATRSERVRRLLRDMATLGGVGEAGNRWEVEI